MSKPSHSLSTVGDSSNCIIIIEGNPGFCCLCAMINPRFFEVTKIVTFYTKISKVVAFRKAVA